jgi:hypothetical protein
VLAGNVSPAGVGAGMRLTAVHGELQILVKPGQENITTVVD